MTTKHKSIIIGAGPAGLTAASELIKKSGRQVLVLEQSQEIGGISRTVNYKGNRMDIGGHRFFSKDDRIMAWWEKTMPLQTASSRDEILLGIEPEYRQGTPQTDPEPEAKPASQSTGEKRMTDPERSDRVLLVRRRVSRIYFLRRFFDYPIKLSAQTLRNMGLARTLKSGCGFLFSSFLKRPENSLEDFYINRFGKPLYKMFFENYTEKVWGIHPSRLGADWGAQRVKGLSIGAILKDIFSKTLRGGKRDQKEVETSLIERFYYPKYGPGQLWEYVAADVSAQGAEVKLGQTVREIQIENKRVVSVTVENEQGETTTMSCDNLLSSMPLKDLIAGIRGAEIDPDVKRIASELPYRDFITVGLLVDKLHLTNSTKWKTWDNRVPDTWIYIQEPCVKIGRMQIFNNWSPYLVENFKEKVWVGLEYFCNEGDELWEMNDDAFIDFAIGELAQIGVLAREDVRDSVRIKVKKAYPSYFGSYYELDKVIDFLNGIENLYCIGRNGQHRYNNMDHSMLTAMKAVEAIEGTSDKSEIWTVNTEKEYHESGKDR